MEQIVKLEEITPTASGVSARTGNAWQKNEIVVLTTGDWQKRFRLTCFGDVCAKAAAIEPGTMVQVQFSIEQREIPAKGDRAAFWVNDVNCHGITPYVAQPLQAQYVPAQPAQPQYQQSQPAQPAQAAPAPSQLPPTQANIPFSPQSKNYGMPY